MNDETSLKFPCSFPIKVMGKKNTAFEKEVYSIVLKHVPDIKENALKINESKSGNYISITILIDAKSKEQLDAIYHDLTACKQIIMAL